MDRTMCPKELLVVVLLTLVVYNAALSDVEDKRFSRCPWIRNALTNGRVKLRSQGRIAKFVCNPGYEIIGKRFATCVGGRWNNPIPICVRPGCSNTPEPPNSRVTESYAGAVLNYQCLPGYKLHGFEVSYCNGYNWSPSPPSCKVPNTQPTMSCDFEDPELCGWTHDPSHEFDWKRNQFGTPSGHGGTGPSYDHTFGKGKGGFYLYQEASSPRVENDASRIFSPVYPANYSGGCFTFWYHMYGSDIGRLRAYIKLESHVFDELRPAWEKVGNQGNQWFRGNISIPSLSEPFQVIIEGVRGISFAGDSAIDDVNISLGGCDAAENATDHVTESETPMSCRGRCREANNSGQCACSDDCDVGDNCCEDYSIICTPGSANDTHNPEEYLTTITPEVFEDTSQSINVTAVLPESSSATSVASTFNSTDAVISSATILVSNTAVPTMSTNTSTTTSAVSSITLTTQPTTLPDTPSTANSTNIFEFSSSVISTNISTTSKPTTKIPALFTTVQIYNKTTTTNLPTTEIRRSTVPSLPKSSLIASNPTLPATTMSSTNMISISAQLPETRKTYNLRPRSSTSTSTMSSTQSSTSTTESSVTSISDIFRSPQFITSSSVAAPVSTTSSKDVITSLNISITPGITTSYSMTIPKTHPHSTSLSTTEQVNVVTSSSLSISSTTTAPPIKFSSPSSTTKATTPLITTKSISTRSTFFTHFRFSDSTTKARWLTTKKIMPSTTITSTASSLRPNIVVIDQSSSKSSSAITNQSTIAGVAVFIVTVACFTVGFIYLMRRRRAKLQSKLSEDSEMKFLSDNEIDEYSDSFVLDKVLVR